jgi:hypothetical protein
MKNLNHEAAVARAKRAAQQFHNQPFASFFTHHFEEKYETEARRAAWRESKRRSRARQRKAAAFERACEEQAGHLLDGRVIKPIPARG